MGTSSQLGERHLRNVILYFNGTNNDLSKINVVSDPKSLKKVVKIGKKLSKKTLKTK